MGGSMFASLNKDKDIVVFEKDSNLGGCASTFKRYGSYFNSGATTFVGYETGHPVKEIFDNIDYKPDIKKSNIAFRVLQNEKTIDRVKDFEEFLDQINKAFPNKNNRVFWAKIKELDEKFWQIHDIYYGKYSLKSYILSANTLIKLFKSFNIEVFKSANSFIKETLGDISLEYQHFIDAQLLITLQTTSKDISLLSLALGLSYPFHDVFYVNGGMGSLFDGLLENIETKNKDEYLSKNVVLNSTIYDSGKLFEDERIKKYYESFDFNDQSAFVVNLVLEKNYDLLHHYLIILDEQIPNCISNSFFISISSKDDEKMSNRGYSITISSHTKASFWKKLNKEEYELKKEQTQEFIIDKLLQKLNTIKKEDIIKKFSASSLTFNRYINRYNCGGRAITMKNVFSTPSAKTPFKGLYNMGDSVFAGQGWPGVAIGVKALNKEFNG
jgi:phytoene dehydrogenase-like protein